MATYSTCNDVVTFLTQFCKKFGGKIIKEMVGSVASGKPCSFCGSDGNCAEIGGHPVECQTTAIGHYDVPLSTLTPCRLPPIHLL